MAVTDLAERGKARKDKCQLRCQTPLSSSSPRPILYYVTLPLHLLLHHRPERHSYGPVRLILQETIPLAHRSILAILKSRKSVRHRAADPFDTSLYLFFTPPKRRRRVFSLLVVVPSELISARTHRDVWCRLQSARY